MYIMSKCAAFAYGRDGRTIATFYGSYSACVNQCCAWNDTLAELHTVEIIDWF